MLEKNLRAIDNDSLKRRLLHISPVESKQGVSYCVTPSNDYVLLKNDMPCDDLGNPRDAIKQMIEKTIKTEMKSNDIIINFGIGLGYLLDETFNKFPSKIFVYEPDIYLLHFVLSNVDISEHLSSGRVFLTNDLKELTDKISAVFLTKDKVEILYLQNYAIAKNKELLMLTQKVFDTCKSKMVDVNTITKFSKKWLINTIANIAHVRDNKAYLLSDLEGKFIGQTAFIAAAGPSLDDNIADLQANRDKFVVFAVNKCVKYLLQNGITPDFVVALDAEYIEKTLSGLQEQLARANCIMDIRTDSSVFRQNFNKIFINFSETDFFIKKIAKYNPSINFYESGGSAATLALVAAAKMGFSKIVFAGLDLAFKENIIYSTGEVLKKASYDEIVVDNVKKKMVQVRSVNGKMVYSREDYQTFITHFAKLIKELNYSEVYNLSSFGAQIEGIKPIAFEELRLYGSSSLQQLTFIKPFNFEIKQFIDEEFCQINNIISMLSKGSFSTALVNTIVKSMFVYQYLQAEVLTVLQKNFDPQLAEEFIAETKTAIKVVVENLQKYKLL